MRGTVGILVGLTAAGLAACSQQMDAAAPAADAAAASGPVAPCPAVENRPLSAAECQEATLVREEVETGAGAFSIEREMRRGVASRVQLAIARRPPPPPPPPELDPSPGPEPAATDAAASADPPAAVAKTAPRPTETPPAPDAPTPKEVVSQNPGQVIEYEPIVGRDMSAELIGDAFDIEPLSPKIQSITRFGPTTWEWSVTPKRGGSQTLTVKTSAIFKDSKGNVFTISHSPRTETVSVRVTPIGRLEDTLKATPKWLQYGTAILTALAAFIAAVWAVIRATKGKRGAPADETPS